MGIESTLHHVLVVGGGVEQWESLSVEEWQKYLAVLRNAVEHVGAKWLTIYPHSGVTKSMSSEDLLQRIANSVSGVVSESKVIVQGATTIVFDACADGRDRFVRAVNALGDGNIKEEKLAQAILHPAIGEPDLVVIFGAPDQLPKSLVWELAYSELVFLQTQWPQCNSEDIELAINDFQRRDRRFGGVDS
ncbi:MAG: hypothetical protein RIS37_56 [Actinomycetota bacterium]